MLVQYLLAAYAFKIVAIPNDYEYVWHSSYCGSELTFCRWARKEYILVEDKDNTHVVFEHLGTEFYYYKWCRSSLDPKDIDTKKDWRGEPLYWEIFANMQNTSYHDLKNELYSRGIIWVEQTYSYAAPPTRFVL